MTDREYLLRALELAKRASMVGEAPVGALVVYKGTIISEAYNLREMLNDASAHAEIIAIRKAGALLGSWRLENSSLYVNLEPCPMCAGCIEQSRISRVAYAAYDFKNGACGSRYNLLSERVTVISGLLQDESRELLKQFFNNKRG